MWTQRNVLTHEINQPATWEEAQQWARHESVDIVPVPVAVAK